MSRRAENETPKPLDKRATHIPMKSCERKILISYNGNIKAVSVIDRNMPRPCEQRHDKTNKMSVRPAKTQIILGIRPV